MDYFFIEIMNIDKANGAMLNIQVLIFQNNHFVHSHFNQLLDAIMIQLKLRDSK